MSILTDPLQGSDLRANQPGFIADELRHIITNAIDNHPRSLQRRIGPSQVGAECARTLAHAINGDPEPERVTPWKPTVGTAVHAWLEQAVRRGDPSSARWLTEQTVTVGDINGQPVTGSCDLFDAMSGTVIDWKALGKTSLANHRRKGASTIYRVQAHLYGRGWVQAGHHVNTVMVVALPRDGELREMSVWSEPYDEQVAMDALQRATAIAQLIDAIGIDAACDAYQPCTDVWCRWCPKQPRFAATAHEAASTASLFASA